MNVVRNNQWGYQIYKGLLDLRIRYYYNPTTLRLSGILGTLDWIAPSIDLTDGIKLEYYTGKKVFLDGTGASADASPDEDSYINLPNTYAPAIENYIKCKMAQDPKVSEFYRKKFEIEIGRASENYTALKPAVTIFPFAMR
jgi:hypothetical protein